MRYEESVHHESMYYAYNKTCHANIMKEEITLIKKTAVHGQRHTIRNKASIHCKQGHNLQ